MDAGEVVLRDRAGRIVPDLDRVVDLVTTQPHQVLAQSGGNVGSVRDVAVEARQEEGLSGHGTVLFWNRRAARAATPPRPEQHFPLPYFSMGYATVEENGGNKGGKNPPYWK